MLRRWALVTGSAGGVGAALVDSLAAAGVPVAGLDRQARKDGPADLVERPVDLADRAEVAALVADLLGRHGAPAFLVHAAAIYPLRTLEALEDGDAERVFAINCLSFVELCRVAVPAMTAAGGGRVLIFSSQAGASGGTDPVYAASKAALVAFGKSLARDYAGAGLRVNTISPGPIDTAMTDVWPQERRRHYEAAMPIGRFATADEVARVAHLVLLAFPDAVNGATIDVDGGLLRR